MKLARAATIGVATGRGPVLRAQGSIEEMMDS